MKEIPKDRQILIKNEYGMKVVARWNGASNEFVYANLQVDYYRDINNDYYFDNECIAEKDIKWWAEL